MGTWTVECSDMSPKSCTFGREMSFCFIFPSTWPFVRNKSPSRPYSVWPNLDSKSHHSHPSCPYCHPKWCCCWAGCRAPVSKLVACLGGLSPQLYFQEQAEQQVTVRGAAAAGFIAKQDHGATLKCQGCTFQAVLGLQGRTVFELDRPPLSFLPSQQLDLQY